MTFYSNQSATLEWSRETIDIERFFWAWEDNVAQLDGNWILVTVPVEGDSTAVIANISDSEASTYITDSKGVELGSIEVV